MSERVGCRDVEGGTRCVGFLVLENDFVVGEPPNRALESGSTFMSVRCRATDL